MGPLFAQHSPEYMTNSGIPAVWTFVFIGAGLIVLFLASATLFAVLRQWQRGREWDHAERMRMLEMGFPVAPHDAPWAKAITCIALGLGAPMATFIPTAMAFASASNPSETIWIPAGIVSGCGAIGGCILGGCLFRNTSKRAPSMAAHEFAPGHNGPGPKPSLDPDAYDSVGRRG